MATEANQAIELDRHSPKPPCDCQACKEATAAANSRRAEITEIMDRIEWLELLAGGVDDE